MKRFKFLLEPVLGQRERIEDERQMHLAVRQRELRAAQDELARLNSEFRRFSGELRSRHKRLHGEELRAHYAHLEYLDRAITMQHAAVLHCRQAVERARTHLTDASKDRKVIEKLKEKRLAEHRALEASSEQKDLDDSNNRRYNRVNR